MSDQAERQPGSYGLGDEEVHGGVSEHHTEGLLESAEDAHRHRYAYRKCNFTGYSIDFVRSDSGHSCVIPYHVAVCSTRPLGSPFAARYNDG